ncbi:medium-chain acyl-CoA ligase ACSF2, mitochondrial-like [Glandiceps talaboti]
MWRLFKPKTSYLHAASAIPYTGMTLPDALDRTAQNFPNKEAFVFASESGKTRISYKQFRDDVIKMAAGLLHLGLQPRDRVGIWFDNRYEWILTQYATAYTKMVHVRFLVGYNEEYMQNLINKTNVSTLVFGSGNPATVLEKLLKTSTEGTRLYGKNPNLPTLRNLIYVGEGHVPGTVSLCDVSKMGNESDIEQVMQIRKSVQSDDEFTILFTSGSTGQPKAVVKSHRCAVENSYMYGRVLSEVIDSDVCYMTFAPFPHAGGDYASLMV